MTIEWVIKKAIEGGWEESNKNFYRLFRVADDLDLALDCVFLDPSFWQSLGKAMGWGTWDKTLEEIKHDWELDHYLPGTGKTPVYVCQKCFARKINNLIEVEYEYEWFEVKADHWSNKKVLNQHATYRKDWKTEWHLFIDHLAEGKRVDDFFATL